MPYFQTDSTTITDTTEENISEMYNKGFVFTRVEKGNMIQTRSLRVNLSNFELSSENRRILKKNEDLELDVKKLPLENYSWEIHALGKDFYTKKFGEGTMSASKIKEMFQEQDKSNMNSVFVYSIQGKNIGYCLSYINPEIVHYAYPFYNLEVPKERSLGLAMMAKAILWSKENGKKYIYLGSVTDSKAFYKLQFKGLEWWDNSNNSWNQDISHLKSATLVEVALN